MLLFGKVHVFYLQMSRDHNSDMRACSINSHYFEITVEGKPIPEYRNSVDEIPIET